MATDPVKYEEEEDEELEEAAAWLALLG